MTPITPVGEDGGENEANLQLSERLDRSKTLANEFVGLIGRPRPVRNKRNSTDSSLKEKIDVIFAQVSICALLTCSSCVVFFRIEGIK